MKKDALTILTPWRTWICWGWSIWPGRPASCQRRSICPVKRFQMDLLIYLLLFMAILIAGVGGLGSAGTMSMNVLERTREMGVLRSIGAFNGAIFQLVVVRAS